MVLLFGSDEFMLVRMGVLSFLSVCPSLRSRGLLRKLLLSGLHELLVVRIYTFLRLICCFLLFNQICSVFRRLLRSFFQKFFLLSRKEVSLIFLHSQERSQCSLVRCGLLSQHDCISFLLCLRSLPSLRAQSHFFHQLLLVIFLLLFLEGVKCDCLGLLHGLSLHSFFLSFSCFYNFLLFSCKNSLLFSNSFSFNLLHFLIVGFFLPFCFFFKLLF